MISPNLEINEKEGFIQKITSSDFIEYWLQPLDDHYYYGVIYDHLRVLLPGTGWVGAVDLEGTYYSSEMLMITTGAGDPNLNVGGYNTYIDQLTGAIYQDDPVEEIGVPIGRTPCGCVEYEETVTAFGVTSFSKSILNESEVIVDCYYSWDHFFVLTDSRVVVITENAIVASHATTGVMWTSYDSDGVSDLNLGVIDTDGAWYNFGMILISGEPSISKTLIDTTPEWASVRNYLLGNIIIPSNILTLFSIYPGAIEVSYIQMPTEIRALYNTHFTVETLSEEVWGEPVTYELEEYGPHHLISISSINPR